MGPNVNAVVGIYPVFRLFSCNLVGRNKKVRFPDRDVSEIYTGSHEEPQGGFFSCRRVPLLLWTLYRRRLSHHFLLCKAITFLAFVIQSEIQRNMISVISFNTLGEHAKGEDVFSARCETATLKSEHSHKNVFKQFYNPFKPL